MTTFLTIACLMTLTHFGLCIPDPYYVTATLADGLTQYSGRVEIEYRGKRGTVCPENWGIPEAMVVCKSIGFNLEPVHVEHHDAGNLPVFLRDVRCQGYESNLAHCEGLWFGNICDSDKRAGVDCFDFTLFLYNLHDYYGDNYQLVDVRLVGGSDESNGRVEMNVNGEWGTICSNYFDDDVGSIICEQLGYSGVSEIYWNGDFGPGDGVIRGVDCYGYESNIGECWRRKPYGCSHFEDVGLSCEYEEPIDFTILRSGRLGKLLAVVVGGLFGLLTPCICVICIMKSKKKSKIGVASRTAPRPQTDVSLHRGTAPVVVIGSSQQVTDSVVHPLPVDNYSTHPRLSLPLTTDFPCNEPPTYNVEFTGYTS